MNLYGFALGVIVHAGRLGRPLRPLCRGTAAGAGVIVHLTRSLWKLKCAFVFSVWGQIPAELDPETPSNGSGLKNGPERDQN